MQDTRGILSPGTMLRHVEFERFDAPTELDGLVEWFWCVRWNFDAGIVHEQQVVAHPAVNISVGTAPPAGTDPPPGPYPLRTVVNGVAVDRTTRALSGSGWNLAARTTVGGFGAWVDDVRALNDRALTLDDTIGADGDRLAREVADTDAAGGVRAIAAVLLDAVGERDPRRVQTAREMTAVARAAEHDRTVRRVPELAALAGVTVRTLQRLFISHVGVSPARVIRRYRLIDAAETVRGGAVVSWAELAVDLGYADQAHLVRDFTRVIGQTPAAYAKAQTGLPGTRPEQQP